MPRKILTEFQIKTILYQSYGQSYEGQAINLNIKKQPKLVSTKRYVLKVDQGVKKRNQLRLIDLNTIKRNLSPKLKGLADKGYDTFLLEEFVPHQENEERYLAFRRNRLGIECFYSRSGGVNIEKTGATSIE